MSDRFFVISGCSGGGKSTVLSALAREGYAVVEEPGRRIVADEIACGGTALPWVDAEAFAERAIAIAQKDLGSARLMEGPVFFDRGLVDAIVALDHISGRDLLADFEFPYAKTVFLTPPWPAIYVQDADRQHGFDDAVAEYHRLHHAYRVLGCTLIELPKVPVEHRTKLILDTVAI